jgi:hypothetical protein
MKRHRGRRVLAWMAGTVGVLVLAGVIVLRTPGFGAVPSGERQARIQASPHWHDGQFRNQQPQWLDLRAALEDAVFGEANEQAHPDAPIAALKTDPAMLAVAPASGLRITWFGHSSTLVEIDGVRVLTDPFWGERSSPLAFIGPNPGSRRRSHCRTCRRSMRS